jgi:5-methylcytosine-specific restriction protein A
MGSTKRFGKRGYCVPSRLPKGPNGRALCRECQNEVPKGRFSFCSDGCVDAWKLRTDPKLQTQFLLERDHGICQLCGLDCIGLLKQLKQLYREERASTNGVRVPKFVAVCEELELPRHLQKLERRLWEADHILPVIEGGGGCGLDNLRTLCWKCHRVVTAELRTRLARARRNVAGDKSAEKRGAA